MIDRARLHCLGSCCLIRILTVLIQAWVALLIGAIEVQVSDAVCTDTDGDGVNDIADADDDNDGQPDSYETTYGFDPLEPHASSDLDGDGLTNVEEYNYQTNPLS